MQTILASLMRLTLPDIGYKREIFTFSDGGQAGLDWEGECSESQPIVLILPGLTGSSQSEYVKTFVNVARKEVGARCCVFNYRGRGGCDLQNARTYCASNSQDLEEILIHIQRSFPSVPVLAVGISLGGIILGNYMADHGEEAKDKLEAAMLVSVCFDTFEGCSSIEKPWINRQLNRHLTKLLIESIHEAKHHFEKEHKLDLEKVFSSTTIREFDTRFTAPLFGFSSCQEYYTAARLYDRIGDIKVNTLALNAMDDPFQPGDSIPREEAARSSHVAILTTEYGGHIGFMEGSLPTRYHFSDRLFAQYLKAVLNEN